MEELVRTSDINVKKISIRPLDFSLSKNSLNMLDPIFFPFTFISVHFGVKIINHDKLMPWFTIELLRALCLY